jgi:hypothetical protein
MTYDVEQANERVWLVEMTGGEITLGANVADLPLGEVVFDRLDLDAIGPVDTTTIDVSEQAGDEQLRVAVVEDGGAYYVSSYYTIAELAASSEGYTMPSAPIAAAGAATPEEAIRGMVDAAIALDVERLIELTPPDEMAALHDYGPILVELADEALAEADIESQLDGWTISVDALDFEQAEVTGGVKLLPVRIAVSGSNVEGQEFEVSVSKVDETCVDFSITATEISGGGGLDEASGRAAPPTSMRRSRMRTSRSRCSGSPSGWSASSVRSAWRPSKSTAGGTSAPRGRSLTFCSLPSKVSKRATARR